jgi:hypothetical protein
MSEGVVVTERDQVAHALLVMFASDIGGPVGCLGSLDDLVGAG